MNIHHALWLYDENMFTDADLTTCAGGTTRSVRELSKIGALKQIQTEFGPGNYRLFENVSFKRYAVTRAFHVAGFSLPMSGRLAYFIPCEETLHEAWDPRHILVDPTKEFERKGFKDTQYPLREKPTSNWFYPGDEGEIDKKRDTTISIIDGRFLSIRLAPSIEPFFYGDLRENGSKFVSWFPFHQDRRVLVDDPAVAKIFGKILTPYKLGDVFSKWEWPSARYNRLDDGFLDYTFEPHNDDDLLAEAQAALENPSHILTINITMAVRRALRKYFRLNTLDDWHPEWSDA